MLKQNSAQLTEFTPAAADAAPFLPDFSPVVGKAVQVTLDTGWVLGAGNIERRLGIAVRLARCSEDPGAPDQLEHRVAEMVRFAALLIAAGYRGCRRLRRAGH